MELIQEYDYKDYKVGGTVGIRPSVRAIIIRDGKLAMVYCKKYDYYMFAGGGIDEGETKEEALIRETQEELGLSVIPESIKEYGLIIRKEKGMFDDLFIQENYFFTCDVNDTIVAQKLEDYEQDEEYTLRWVTPKTVIETNNTHNHSRQENETYYKRMLIRENSLVERLVSEGKL